MDFVNLQYVTTCIKIKRKAVAKHLRKKEIKFPLYGKVQTEIDSDIKRLIKHCLTDVMRNWLERYSSKSTRWDWVIQNQAPQTSVQWDIHSVFIWERLPSGTLTTTQVVFYNNSACCQNQV